MIGGVIGLYASLVLSYDTLQIAKNPHYIPSCNLNPVLSCGNVINTAGDTILKLPYPYYGVAAFAVLITVGAGIVAGAKYKRWFWLTFQVALSFGALGSYYLLLKSVYKIHALCPYCLSVDVVVTTLIWYLTLYNIDQKNIVLSKKGPSKRIYAWIRQHHLDLLILWFLIVIALIVKHFWYYYGKHL
jgi:uncharacterized membrane protein